MTCVVYAVGQEGVAGSEGGKESNKGKGGRVIYLSVAASTAARQSKRGMLFEDSNPSSSNCIKRQ